MSKIPRKIPIGDSIYKVKEVNVAVDDNGEPAHATCDIKNKVIEIEKDLSCLEKAEYFIHEVGHGLWNERGLDDEVSNQWAWIEHIVVVAFAKHIVRNRKLYVDLLSD